MFHPRGLRARFPRLLPPVHHQTDVASVFPGHPAHPLASGPCVPPLCAPPLCAPPICVPRPIAKAQEIPAKSLKGFHETSALPVVCLNATRVLLPDPSTNHDLAHVYPNPEHHQFRCPVLVLHQFRGPVLRGSVFRREIPGEWSRVQSGSVPLK